MKRQSNLALVKTKAATAQVAARPAGKDKFGNPILSQNDIDRVSCTARPEYKAQLFGKIVSGELPRRSVWQRLRGRFF